MFQSKSKSGMQIDTPGSGSASIISAGTTLKGDITSNGDIRIDGSLKGNVYCSAKVVIGANGVVEGDIHGQQADIMGKVNGSIKEGGVQWMTAGSGVLHKEYHEEEFSNQGGDFQMVQIWVNLPAKYKMTAPKYQEIANNKMGKHVLGDSKSFMEVIAGNFEGTEGPAFTFTPMEVYNAHLQKGSSVSLNLPSNYNTGLLVIEGTVSINNQPIGADHFVYFKNEEGSIEIKANSPSIVLILSGKPIDEPIAAYGPFLMNTWEELEQAVVDVNSGKFGSLEE